MHARVLQFVYLGRSLPEIIDVLDRCTEKDATRPILPSCLGSCLMLLLHCCAPQWIGFAWMFVLYLICGLAVRYARVLVPSYARKRPGALPFSLELFSVV